MKNASKITCRRRRFLRDESGQALVLTAVCLAGIMGVAALAIDLGQLQATQRRMQTAADAAALAGALEVGACGTTDHCAAMTGAASDAVTENGFGAPTVETQCTAGGTGLVLTVNNGPCALGSSDPNNANPKFVEVELTQPQNTFFARVFGITSNTVTVRAEAGYTGTPGGGGGSCWLSHGITLNGTATVSTTCGIGDNGDLTDNGNDVVDTPSFTYTGNYTNNCHASNCYTDASPVKGSAWTDPLSGLTAPSKPGTKGTGTLLNGNNLTATLQPGYYASGYTINGTGNTVTLSPGVYYMGADFIVNGGNTLTGTGVTLYFTSGTLLENGSSDVELSAPDTSTNGDNAGMLIWQAKGDSTSFVINGTSNSFYQGAIYLPNSNAGMTINGDAGVTVNSGAKYTIVDVGGASIINGGDTFDMGDTDSPISLGGGNSGTASLAE